MIGRLTKWQRIFGALLVAFLVTEAQLAYLSVRATINAVYTDGIMVVERGPGYRVGHIVKGREALRKLPLLWRSRSAQVYAFRTAAVTPTFSTFYGQGVGPAPQNLEYLGFSQCDTGAASCGTCPVPLKDQLHVQWYTPGYAGAARISLRFGTGTTAVDTGTNYAAHGFSYASAAAALTFDTASTAFGFCRMASVTGTTVRSGTCDCNNVSGQAQEHICICQSALQVTTGNTVAPSAEQTTCKWTNTGQINQIELTTDASTLLAGAVAFYFGKNMNAP